jgi:hypothetical protein
MKKSDNIFLKLQIEKDASSGDLILNIHFNKDTPNLITEKDEISWCPTVEEINFVNEAFDLIAKNKGFKQKKVHIESNSPPEEKKPDDKNKSSNDEKGNESKAENKDKEESQELSDEEKKDVNEWFV